MDRIHGKVNNPTLVYLIFYIASNEAMEPKNNLANAMMTLDKRY